MNIKPENKNRIISIGATILFHIAIIVLLLCAGLPYMDPPPPEMGVLLSEDNLTEIEQDQGSQGAMGGGENIVDPANVDQDNAENTLTQKDDSPLQAEDKKAKAKPIDKPKEQAVDQNALFKKGKVSTGGSGIGKDKGHGTSQGQGSGLANQGQGQSSNGVSFVLSGRGSKALNKPKTNRTDTGKVLVEIFVDRQGNVVQAKGGLAGTTLMNVNIWRTCEQAAKRSTFTANPSAPELQRGVITYIFAR